MKITKEHILSVIFIICLGLLFNSLEFVALKKVCEYPEYGPVYFGFPFIYRTNMTWVNSGSGIVFVLNWFVNILFWSLLFFGLWNITKTAFNLRTGFSKVIKLSVIVISICFQILLNNVYSLQYEFIHDVNLNYYEQEIYCKSKFLFFNFGLDTKD